VVSTARRCSGFKPSRIVSASKATSLCLGFGKKEARDEGDEKRE
jgi:hypothetical protein